MEQLQHLTMTTMGRNDPGPFHDAEAYINILWDKFKTGPATKVPNTLTATALTEISSQANFAFSIWKLTRWRISTCQTATINCHWLTGNHINKSKLEMYSLFVWPWKHESSITNLPSDIQSLGLDDSTEVYPQRSLYPKILMKTL